MNFSPLFNILSNLRQALKNQKYQKGLLKFYLFVKIKSFIINLLRFRINKEKLFNFKLNFTDYSSFLFLFEEIFVRNEYHFETKRENPLIIDCGSNIGVSLLFFKRVYPKSEIMCFEPSKKLFKILKRNIEINKLENVCALNKAVADFESKTKLYCGENVHAFSLDEDRSSHVEFCEEVDVICLSKYVKKKVDLLKLDVEGSENRVLRDLSKNKKLQFISELIIEYHHFSEKEDNKLSEILKILECSSFKYNLRAVSDLPFRKDKFQDILIHAYKN